MRIASIANPSPHVETPATVLALDDDQYLELSALAYNLNVLHSGTVFKDIDPVWDIRQILHLKPALLEVLERWGTSKHDLPARLARHVKSGLHEQTFLPPVPGIRSFRDFYAFEEHVKTARALRGLEMNPAWYAQPVFYFSNAGSLVGHGHPVFAPKGCAELDYELELGIVIGKGGKNIPAEKTWEHVAGFTIVNDLSARDIQREEMKVGLGPAKGKDFATAVGPYLVTLDEFKDRIDAKGRVDLPMKARVNGKELTKGNAKLMHFPWPQIIERASADAELFPGDLIGSGTVGGGCILELTPEKTGGWLKPGDVVELEIDKLGVLRTPIVERPA